MIGILVRFLSQPADSLIMRTQQAQNICITFVQCWTNVVFCVCREDYGMKTLRWNYRVIETDVLCLCLFENVTMIYCYCMDIRVQSNLQWPEEIMVCFR